MARHQLQRLQLERLRTQVRHVYDSVPFYRAAFDRHHVRPGDVNTLNDLATLPFTTKLDFRDNYPLGLLAVPTGEVARVHASSGTTGKPTVAAYTARDIDTWAEIMARGLATSGVVTGDVVQNALGYGLFTGGLGFHYGLERLGATVVPTGTGNTKRQLTLLQDLGATVLACTPSYALIMAETAREMGIDLKKTRLRLVLCGAEPWSEGMRQDIQDGLGVAVLDNYGLTEAIGPGVSFECEYRCGLHIPEDHFLVEVVDPGTGEPLPYGHAGELVITTLTREAYPVVRFRTRDITSLDPEPCRCGRTHIRMSRVAGRSDDMLVVRGVNVFPSQIENVILGIEDVMPHYQIVVDRQHAFSYRSLEVWVEVDERVLNDPKEAQKLSDRVCAELDSALGISTPVKLVASGTLLRAEGKAKRIVDRGDL
jgi:phenylacetate-CoA ligase